MDYVPQGAVAQVREYLANYQRTREILEEICAINRELLRRRERL
jgi:cell shape-determining protein MreC